MLRKNWLSLLFTEVVSLQQSVILYCEVLPYTRVPLFLLHSAVHRDMALHHILLCCRLCTYYICSLVSLFVTQIISSVWLTVSFYLPVWLSSMMEVYFYNLLICTRTMTK